MLPEERADEAPIWERPQFVDAIMGSSLSAEAPSPSGPALGPSCTMGSLIDSLTITASLIGSLQESTTVPVVRAAASKVHVAIKRCLELCSHMPSVKDPESFYSLLAPFVARIKALEPGSVLVVPAGWRTGVVMLVLHCDSIDYFSLAVVTAVDGISHHPMRTNPATGMPQHNSPLLLRRVPAARAQDSAVWFVILKACFFPDERHTAGLFYKQILPFSNRRPVLSNLAPGEAGGAGESASTAWIERGTRGRPARVHAGEPRGDDGTPAGRLRTAQGSRRLLWWRRRRQRRRVAGL
jgi:hypothetical protein